MSMTDATPSVLAGLAERFNPTPSPYKNKPITWTREKLGEYVPRNIRKVMKSVRDNRYTAVQSCHDVGKSWSSGRIAGWWLDTHPIGEAIVVTTAPTASQVGSILWHEINNVHALGELVGYITGENKWKVDRKDTRGKPLEIAVGRKPADYDPAAFQGYHRRYVLVIIDEACGVPHALYNAIDSIVTNENCRVLAIGNPDDPSSHFATICKPGSGWNVIRINALETLGFTKERIEPYPQVAELMRQMRIKPSKEKVPSVLYEMLVSPMWVDERIKRWGIDSPLFQSKVLGLFPNVSIDTLIHPHWVTLAQARELAPLPTMARQGVDVARYGTDHTIIVLRQGGHARVVQDIAYGPLTQVRDKVVSTGMLTYDGTPVRQPVAVVDDGGLGGGVVDMLEELGYPVVAFIGQAASHQLMRNGKPRFYNRRSEAFWNLREALAGESGTGEDGWLDLDPHDDELAAQLTNIKYRVNKHGQIQVESKDEMKARGLSSPDRADALAYAVVPDEPRITAEPHPEHMITAGILQEKW